MMAQPPLATDPDASGPLTLDVRSIGMTDAQFYRLCCDNPELRFELTARRELVIAAPTGSKTGWRNSKLNQRLANWAEQDGSGLAFDSSTGFSLPNGAKRSPDASWLHRERRGALTEREQEGFAPLCPDFVVELRSPEDRLPVLQDKMTEYLQNGAQLGWLIDPADKCVYVYRPGQPEERLQDPATISGDPVLLGFVLSLADIC
jgi:Uma2 family endonuclease